MFIARVTLLKLSIEHTRVLFLLMYKTRFDSRRIEVILGQIL